MSNHQRQAGISYDVFLPRAWGRFFGGVSNYGEAKASAAGRAGEVHGANECGRLPNAATGFTEVCQPRVAQAQLCPILKANNSSENSRKIELLS